jgi:hypothetical protein
MVLPSQRYWIKLDLQKKRRTVADERMEGCEQDLHGPVVVDLVLPTVLLCVYSGLVRFEAVC